jgi:NhaC family Na+:H+ antiporter
VTSVLVPWNTCGAYISGVLGVPTASYLPFCFFNILSPVLDVLFGFLGFKVQTVPASEPAPDVAVGDAGERAPEQAPG